MSDGMIVFSDWENSNVLAFNKTPEFSHGVCHISGPEFAVSVCSGVLLKTVEILFMRVSASEKNKAEITKDRAIAFVHECTETTVFLSHPLHQYMNTL